MTTPGELRVEEIVPRGGSIANPQSVVLAHECYRLVQTTYQYGVLCQNVFHFGREATGGSAASLVTDWRDNIVPAWKAVCTMYTTFDSVTAQMVAPFADVIQASPLSGTGGLGNTCPLPPCAAGILTWRTQLTGRRNRGRTYVAGLEWVGGTSFPNGTWGGPGITRLTNLGTAILNRYTLGGNPYGFFLVVYSRINAGSGPTVDPTVAASMVNRFTMQSAVGTMGSRRYGRGL